MIFTKEEVELAKSKNLKIWVIGTTKDSFKKDIKHHYRKININLNKYSDIYNKFITTNLNIEGDNINYISKLFNEFCAMYYVWKNNLKSEYIGFCHYRRQIPISMLDYKKLEQGKIQYFSSHYNIRYNISHKVDKILQTKYQHFYAWLTAICYAEDTNLYNDLEEYFDKQEYFDKDKIKEYCDYTKYLVHPQLIPRCLFVCKWEVFDNMMKLFVGYFEFLVSKYNLHNEQEWKNFYKENYINHYIKNWNNLVEEYGDSFVTRNTTKKILLRTEDNGYNLVPPLYAWRLFAILLEEMFSMYIVMSPSFYTCLLEDSQRGSQGDIKIYNVFKYLKKHKYKNLLFVSDFNYEFLEMINLYKSINHGTKFKILNLSLNKKKIDEYTLPCFKHINNLYNDNLIKDEYLKNNKFDFIFLDKIDDNMSLYCDQNIHTFINALESNSSIVIFDNLYVDKSFTQKYPILFKLLNDKKFKYEITSFKTLNYKIIYFIKLKKRD